jgi:PAS domain S-box-containing protein
VRFVNPSAEVLTGWSNEQALGHDVRELVRFRPEPDHRAAGDPEPTDAVERALQRGEVVGIDHALRLCARDGREVAVDQSASPIDDSSRRLGAVLVLRDATRRLEQESRLRASEERFRNAFDHAPLGMALIAFDGRFLQVNGALCRWLGRDADTLREQGQDRVTWPADLEYERQQLHALLEGCDASAAQFEKRYRHADGRTLLPALVSVSVMVEDERPTCWLYQIHDLTEQKQAAQRLAELTAERLRREASEIADQAKSEFLSRASHEMRTPLNAVLGFAQLLQRDSVARDPGRTQRFAKQIFDAGEHLLVMVNDVLDLQRVAQGQLRLNSRPLPLADVVRDVCDLLAEQAHGRDVVLHRDVGAGLTVYADENRLRQVLMNLGSNAIKYNKAGGSVRFDAFALSTRVRLVVSDTGCGMTPEQLTRLFQPFDRLGQERGEIPGTGLGLLIARSLVVEMRGTLQVESEPGVGTRVVVDLRAP